jgi:DNA mismatch repair ATPase MutL
VILDFTIPHHQYDVNLTPDKKTVLLSMEDEVLDRIVTAATELWSNQVEGRFVVTQTMDQSSVGAKKELPLPSSSTAPPPPQRRRYAFVHDPSSAVVKEREEHQKRFQFEKRRTSDAGIATATCIAATTTTTHDYAADDDDERAIEEECDDDYDQGDRKRSASSDDDDDDDDDDNNDYSIGMDQQKRNAKDVSTIATTTEHPKDKNAQPPTRKRTLPLPSTAPTGLSSFAATWKEKQKWREAQVRFNSQDEEDEYDDPLVRVPPTKQQRRFGLERFGFTSSSAAAVAHVSDRTPRLVSDDNVADQAQQFLESTAKRHDKDLTPPTMDEDEARARTARIVSVEKISFDGAPQADDLDDDTFVVPSPSAGSISTAAVSAPSRANNLHQSRSSSSDSLQVAQFPNASIDSPQFVFIDDGHDKVESSCGPPESFTEATSSPVQARKVSEVQTSPVESDVIWSHFGSTEDVMSTYRSDRLSLSMRKRKLKELKGSEKTDNEPVEASIRLKKEQFRHMQVIGQFNMGFILAKDSGGNIWILDQHACDEKHKFEKLCAETTIHDQRLMAPLPLELSSLQEACIQDNMAVFEKNGFRFQYDDGKPPGRRCALTALPHSGAQNGRNAVQYGKDDVIALCALLMGEEVDGGTGTDGSGMYGNNAVRRYASSSQQGQVDTIMARLPKTIAMFASRACRTSIMVGTALSQKEMEKLVHRLADIEQPWNCPHGRPTLQHVRQLCSVLLDDEKRTEALIAEPTVTVLSQEDGDGEDNI